MAKIIKRSKADLAELFRQVEAEFGEGPAYRRIAIELKRAGVPIDLSDFYRMHPADEPHHTRRVLDWTAYSAMYPAEDQWSIAIRSVQPSGDWPAFLKRKQSRDPLAVRQLMTLILCFQEDGEGAWIPGQAYDDAPPAWRELIDSLSARDILAVYAFLTGNWPAPAAQAPGERFVTELMVAYLDGTIDEYDGE